MRRILTVLTVVGAIVALGAAPASAQSKSRKDPAHDAPTRVDIRSTTVQNGGTRFVVTVRLATVVKRQTSVEIAFGRDYADETDLVLMEALPISRGRYSVRGAVLDGAGELRPLRCAAGRARVKTGARGYFRFAIAQACLGSLAGRQVTQAAAYDKRDLSEGIVGGARSTRHLRRGDASEPGEDREPFDSTSLITTRRH